MKNSIYLYVFLLSISIYGQKKSLEYGSSIESVEVINLSCEDYLISGCLYLESGDQYYSYYKNINNDECNSFIFDGYEKSLLKNELTSSIITFISTISTSQFNFRNSKTKKAVEEEIFKSESKSYSNAILFNPKFAYCNDNDSRKIIVYVEKSKFDRNQKLFFEATIKRLSRQLTESRRFKILNPNYQFVKELKQIDEFLKILRSFLSLMISLDIDEITLDKYLTLEDRSKNFKNSINNLNSNLIRVDEYLSTKNYTSAYNLIKELKVKFNSNDQSKKIKQKENNYLDLVRLEKDIRKKEFKKNTFLASDMLSLDANFNSALVNNSTNSSGERNYSNNSPFDRMYPALGFKFIINDRNRKWGLGPYYKLHLSQSLIVLKNIEYFFPFSKNFSEVGLWGQYFINSYSSSITFSAAKLLGNYQDLNGDPLNFWTFSPGYKIKLNKTSFYGGFIITRADSEFSFNGLSLGISYDIKFNNKITKSQMNKLDEEFPIKF